MTQSGCRIVFCHAEDLKMAKSFGPCQPERNAQADMGRYFSQVHKTPFHRPLDIVITQKNLGKSIFLE